MCALTHLRGSMVEHNMVDLTVAMDLDFRPAVFRIAERKADVFESGSKTSTADNRRLALVIGRESIV
jgi:hypothetical protein